uniref:Uncharacterized protein n=1 Tax=Solanum tuberosum TaxID=4113 RepID=M1DWD4_SOLTU
MTTGQNRTRSDGIINVLRKFIQLVWYIRGGEEYASTPEAAKNFLAFWYARKDGEHRGSLVVRRSRRWYGKMKTVERGTRLVRGNELVRRLMVFGFVEVGEG